MKSSVELKNELFKIDSKGYKAYKVLEGKYDFKKYVLSIDHVQGDPFASPSRVRIIIDNKIAQIPEELFDNKNKEVAVCDFLTRLFSKNIKNQSEKIFGSGKSGLIEISRCPQEILERTAIIRNKNFFEARFYVGFPARGRSVLARELEKIIFNIIPNIVENTFIYKNINKLNLINRVKLIEDQFYIRKNLKEKGLVAFVANESILPRESGVSARPLRNGKKFISPQVLEVEFDTPNRGKIKGMGIPKGITLIIGGGYHGKSTLLRALELGIYNHIEGDGREFVITDESALKVRAEDGRAITSTDISLFINNLPNGKDTIKFNTENASGSTSQAANIIEAIESKSKVLLIDEDTSATNFMIRDDIMQQLVVKEKEPITPFIDVAKSLYKQLGISTILVAGSCGDFFDIADLVIQMDSYEPYEVTAKAKELSRGKVSLRDDLDISIDFGRVLDKGSISEGPKGIKIKTLGKDGLSINKENIDLKSVEQIVDGEQINTIGMAIKFIEDKYSGKDLTIEKIADEIEKDITKNLIGIDNIKGGNGSLAMPRKQEILCAINRLRTLKIKK
ncbi:MULTISPECIES: ABC-ATPase domain-containing protein [Clostridia]|uniref:ABC-ATPase domain-containing protein n=2 Tax=Clostridia TaxID=186801 RepID=A0A8I0A5E7_9CLOT|nr:MULTISPECIES: ABC-ATPase domain-containing protein [Clostridia]MBC5640378.1 ABC-ATPase domain-containing protein [Clostridium lentum]MBC5654596.1 ABC-ATPase domain-containing protein [Blautia lenta]